MYYTSVRIGPPYENNKFSWEFLLLGFFFPSVCLEVSYHALPPNAIGNVEPFLQAVAKREENPDVS